VLALNAPAVAEDSGAVRTLTIYSSTSPGGGYDAYARLLAKYIGRYLPGNPEIIVKNLTGGAGFVLANYLYNIAPKNGTEIGILENNLPFAPLYGDSPMHFDVKKFGWLGSLDQYVPIVLAWEATGFRTLDDLRKNTMTVGGTGVGGNMSTYAYVLDDVLGTKLKVINGYPGSTEITLAVERGELQGMTGWCWTCMKFQKPEWVADKKVNVIMQLAATGDPELNTMGVPTVLQLATSDEQKQLLSVVFASAAMARPFTAPPGLAPDRLALLRQAFEKAAKDPELVADGAKSGNEVNFVSADAVIQLINTSYATDAALLKRLRAAVAGKE
jgi:tripartite-type tricarboxylate transporter receptor subunit TctC